MEQEEDTSVSDTKEIKPLEIIDSVFLTQQMEDDVEGKTITVTDFELFSSSTQDVSIFKKSSKNIQLDRGNVEVLAKNEPDNYETCKKDYEDRRPFKCNECEKTYFNERHLRRHHKSVHNKEKRFTCSFCDYGTYYKHCLESHVAIHTLHKGFKCDVCNYSCYRQCDLVAHKKRHRGVKPHKCQECSSAFTSTGHLKDHKLSVHRKVKRVMCSVCGYRSYFVKVLKNHLAAHLRNGITRGHVIDLQEQTDVRLIDEQLSTSVEETLCEREDFESVTQHQKNNRLSADIETSSLNVSEFKIVMNQNEEEMPSDVEVIPLESQPAEGGFSKKSLEMVYLDHYTQQLKDVSKIKLPEVVNFDHLPQQVNDSILKKQTHPVDCAVVLRSGRPKKDSKFSGTCSTNNQTQRGVDGVIVNDVLDHTKTSKQVHTRVKGFKCNECTKEYLEESHLKRHQRSVHNKEIRFNCSSCDFSTFFKQSLIGHVATHTLHKGFKCDVCSYSSYRQGDLVAHKKRHRGVKPHKCHECGSAFSSTGHLKDHKLSVHRKVKRVMCSVCGYRSYFVKVLKNHLVAHFRNGIKRGHVIDLQEQKDVRLTDKQLSTSVEETVCEREDFEPVTQHQKNIRSLALLDHTKTSKQVHTRVKGFKCNECTKEYFEESHLKRHIRSFHRKEKRFTCSSCHFSTFHKQNLIGHVATHTLHKGFKCDVCSYSCYRKCDLVAHKKRHRGVKPHKCNECGSAFASTGHLKDHKLSVHRKAKRVMCSVCGYRSYFMKHLKNHLALHFRNGITRGHVIDLQEQNDVRLTDEQLSTSVEETLCEREDFESVTQHQKNNRLSDDMGTNSPNVSEFKIVTHQNEDDMPSDVEVIPLESQPAEGGFSKTSLEMVYLDHYNQQLNNVSKMKLPEVVNFDHLPQQGDDSILKKQTHPVDCPVVLRRGRPKQDNRFSGTCSTNNQTQRGVDGVIVTDVLDHTERSKQVHTRVKCFKCNECTKEYLSESHLKSHQRSVHRKKIIFTCSYCDFSTFYKQRLIGHVATHTLHKGFKCDVCSYSCYRQDDLIAHKKRHRGTKPHKCHECGSAFTSTRQLNDHTQSVHRKVKRGMCSVCGYRSYFMNDLKRHLTAHFRNGITSGQIINLQEQRDVGFYGGVDPLNIVHCVDGPKITKDDQLSTTAQINSVFVEECEAVTEYRENNEFSAANETKPVNILDCEVVTHRNEDQTSVAESSNPLEFNLYLQPTRNALTFNVCDLYLLPQQVTYLYTMNSPMIVNLDLLTQQAPYVPEMSLPETVDFDLLPQQQEDVPEMKPPEIMDLDLLPQQQEDFPKMKSPETVDVSLTPERTPQDFPEIKPLEILEPDHCTQQLTNLSNLHLPDIVGKDHFTRQEKNVSRMKSSEIVNFDTLPQQTDDSLVKKHFEFVDCAIVLHRKKEEQCSETAEALQV